MREYLKNRFKRCQGACRICFNDGACKLQDRVNKKGLVIVRKEAYNE